VIGLLGTEATIRQVYVDRLEAEFAAGKTLLRHGAPELVQAAEAQLRGEPVDPAVYARAAAALRAMPGDRIDTVVLACTHFPLVQPELAHAFGGDVRFIDGSDGIARRIAALTEGQNWNREQDDVALFTRGGRMWNACGRAGGLWPGSRRDTLGARSRGDGSCARDGRSLLSCCSPWRARPTGC
jgi:glutamate racemase